MRNRLLLLVIILGCISCSKTVNESHEHVICDIEGFQFRCPGHLSEYEKVKTSEHSYEGKYSVWASSERPKTLRHLITGIALDDTISISVKRFSTTGNGVLIARTKGPKRFLAFDSTGTKTDKDGWELLQLYVSGLVVKDSLWIHVENGSTTPVYFDDLQIFRSSGLSPDLFKAIKPIEIRMDSLDLAKIEKLRADAEQDGFLSNETKESFLATATFQGHIHRADVRLKGDWTDHLSTKKPSFRVRLKGKHRINGMSEFSIQHPKTRGYLHEWFLHQLFEMEGVLTTKFDFAPVILGGRTRGVFAVEEHFSFDLPVRQARKKGIILKFDEAYFWKRLQYANPEFWKEQTFPLLSSATISMFKSNSVLRSGKLSSQFGVARSLMQRYANFDPDISEYLDLDQTAKYYALLYFIRSLHGSNWHNQRWYFNAANEKLEPIGFDCTASLDLRHPNKPTFATLFNSTRNGVPHEEAYLQLFLFKDESFIQKFTEHLSRVSTPGYLDMVFKQLDNDITRLETLLSLEMGQYQFDREYYRIRAQQVRADLPGLAKWFSEERNDLQPYSFEFADDVPLIVSIAAPLKVYRSEEEGFYDLQWYGAHEVSVIGINQVKLPAINTSLAPYPNSRSKNRMPSTIPIRSLQYMIEGSDSIFNAEIIPWSPPNLN